MNRLRDQNYKIQNTDMNRLRDQNYKNESTEAKKTIATIG